MVQITNTDFLKLLLQIAPEYRDRFWVLQTLEHISVMEDITGLKDLKSRAEVERTRLHLQNKNENI